MAADPNKMLISLTPDTREGLERIAAEDAEIGRKPDMSASVRSLIRAEILCREKSQKKSQQKG